MTSGYGDQCRGCVACFDDDPEASLIRIKALVLLWRHTISVGGTVVLRRGDQSRSACMGTPE